MQTVRLGIKGMHCSGCENFIITLLEQQGMRDIYVNRKKNEAVFQTVGTLALAETVKHINNSQLYSVDTIDAY